MLTTRLCSIAALGLAALLVACTGETGATGPAGPEGPGGPEGSGGADGTSCTVIDNGDGTKTIMCDDGTTVVVTDGTPGASCTVADDGDGCKTITCDDGTSAQVCDGKDGTGTGPTVDPNVNYIAVHDPASPRFDDDCLSCHVGKNAEVSLDPGIPGFHARKLASSVISGATLNDKCVYCHPTVDLSPNRSAVSLRRNVDATTCSACHAAGTYDFYAAP